MAVMDYLKSAGTGAVAGSAFGPIGSLVGAGIGAGGAALGGWLGSKDKKETSIQRTQRHLIDKMLASIEGNGPFSDLFNFNEQQFQKNIADPYRQELKTKAFPQIQQSYISSGAQGSTGLEDALVRAGIDLENQIGMMRQQGIESALNRKSGGIGKILGQDSGAPAKISGLDAALQGIGGYLSSDAFGQSAQGLARGISNKFDSSYMKNDRPKENQIIEPETKGFES